MGTADGAMGGSYGAREFGANEWAGARWRQERRLALVGVRNHRDGSWFHRLLADWSCDPRLQVLAAPLRRPGSADAGDQQMAGCAHHDVGQFFFVGLRRREPRARFYGASTGNAAFNDWRTAELARLDEERRKLDEAQREFAEYSDAIRRAKDREEFDRFMAERRARPAGGGSNAN